MKFQALFSWKNKSKKIKVVGAVVFIRINMVIQVPGYALISGACSLTRHFDGAQQLFIIN